MANSAMAKNPFNMNSARTTMISRANIPAFYRSIEFGCKRNPAETPIPAKVANVLCGTWRCKARLPGRQKLFELLQQLSISGIVSRRILALHLLKHDARAIDSVVRFRVGG